MSEANQRGKNLYGEQHFGLISYKIIRYLDGINSTQGVKAAFLLDFLLARYLHYRGTNELNDNGYLFMKVKTLEEAIGMNESTQKRLLNYLEGAELITKYVDQISGNIRYIKVLVENVEKICRLENQDIVPVPYVSEEQRLERSMKHKEQKEKNQLLASLNLDGRELQTKQTNF